MAIRKRIRHVAWGVLGSFNGRNNDLDGYWTMGLLYKELGSAPRRLELDLLARTATPAGNNAVLIAGRYADFLREALLEKKLKAADLLEATVTLQFNAERPHGDCQPWLVGDPYTCSVKLRSADEEVIYTAHGKCMPHDPHLFRRSGRASAAQRG